MRRILIAVTIVLMLGGCTGVQSALAPGGPEAERILRLATVLLCGAAAIFAGTLAAVWIALRGPADIRRRIASDKVVVAAGAAFPFVTLSVLLFYGLHVMRASGSSLPGPAPVQIEVTGEQWWWRVVYLDASGGPSASANEIRIPVGREVEFHLRSPDVIHSFWIPALGGKLDMTPGRTTKLRLKADRAGVYRGQCAEYCGGAHALMGIEVIALNDADFADWLASESRPGREPTDEAGRRGRQTLLASGCGSCHAIRGTAAQGAIGPDLTRVGARRSIAAATLPNSRDNLERYVASPHDVKPGINMPPFRFLSKTELSDIATYLGELK